MGDWFGIIAMPQYLSLVALGPYLCYPPCPLGGKKKPLKQPKKQQQDVDEVIFCLLTGKNFNSYVIVVLVLG